MACVHLKQLYDLCQEHELKLGATDLIRVVCRQCGEQEVCPSNLMEVGDLEAEAATQGQTQGKPSPSSAK